MTEKCAPCRQGLWQSLPHDRRQRWSPPQGGDRSIQLPTPPRTVPCLASDRRIQAWLTCIARVRTATRTRALSLSSSLGYSSTGNHREPRDAEPWKGLRSVLNHCSRRCEILCETMPLPGRSCCVAAAHNANIETPSLAVGLAVSFVALSSAAGQVKSADARLAAKVRRAHPLESAAQAAGGSMPSTISATVFLICMGVAEGEATAADVMVRFDARPELDPSGDRVV